MLLMRRARRDADARPGPLQRLYRAFDQRFERVRRAYALTLSALLSRRKSFAVGFLAFCVLSCLLYPVLGRDFFPSVDAGQIRLHMRAATGTRIEETARIADRVEAAIRELIPPDQLETILDNLGVPNSGINLSYSNAGTIGTLDGEIQLSLRPGHRPTEEIVTLLRAELPRRFPGVEFFFQPADIVTQILNFGLPAAIDVQFGGPNMAANAALGRAHQGNPQDPGAVDARTSGSTPGSTCKWTARGCSRPASPRSTSGRTCCRRSAARRLRRPSGSTRATAWSTTSRCRRRSTASIRSTRCSTCRWRAPEPRPPAVLATRPPAPSCWATGGRHAGAADGHVSRYNILPAIDLYVSAGHRL
jgi:hypothetical protein